MRLLCRQKGSLLVLSIDGKMAVSLEEEYLACGCRDDGDSAVTPRFREKEGKQWKVRSEKSSVNTLTDNGTSVGEKITVWDKRRR